MPINHSKHIGIIASRRAGKSYNDVVKEFECSFSTIAQALNCKVCNSTKVQKKVFTSVEKHVPVDPYEVEQRAEFDRELEGSTLPGEPKMVEIPKLGDEDRSHRWYLVKLSMGEILKLPNWLRVRVTRRMGDVE